MAAQGCKQRAYNAGDTASAGRSEGVVFGAKYNTDALRKIAAGQGLAYNDMTKCYAKGKYNRGGVYRQKLNDWELKGRYKAKVRGESCSASSKCQDVNYFGKFIDSGYGYCDAQAIGQYISGTDPQFFRKYGTKYSTVRQGKVYIGMKWYRKINTTDRAQRSNLFTALEGVRSRSLEQARRERTQSEFCQNETNRQANVLFGKHFGYCDAEAVGIHLLNGRVDAGYTTAKKGYIRDRIGSQGLDAAKQLVAEARAHVAQLAAQGKIQGEPFCQFKNPESCGL
jgi:hypothetical protein